MGVNECILPWNRIWGLQSRRHLYGEVTSIFAPEPSQRPATGKDGLAMSTNMSEYGGEGGRTWNFCIFAHIRITFRTDGTKVLHTVYTKDVNKVRSFEASFGHTKVQFYFYNSNIRQYAFFFISLPTYIHISSAYNNNILLRHVNYAMQTTPPICLCLFGASVKLIAFSTAIHVTRRHFLVV